MDVLGEVERVHDLSADRGGSSLHPLLPLSKQPGYKMLQEESALCDFLSYA